MMRARMDRPRRRGGGALLALAALLLAGALAGCVKPMVKVDDFAQVGANDVLMVGRVELVPPLKPGEQDIKLSGPYNDENQYFFFINNKAVAVANNPEKTPYDDILMEKFGNTFYVKNARRPVHFTVSFLYLTLTRQKMERVWLPGGLVVGVQPGDRAVYMGTIRYHRNEFFDLSKVEVVDEFDRERKAFAEKFGTATPLVRRLARPSGG
jgi:hypothetical protein